MSETKVNTDETGAVGERVSLAQMLADQKGKIVGISGGHSLVRKLEALGIREGKEIKKISEQWMRGPVLLQHGHSQVALGFGMASKIFVEINGKR